MGLVELLPILGTLILCYPPLLWQQNHWSLLSVNFLLPANIVYRMYHQLQNPRTQEALERIDKFLMIAKETFI